ncbi:MAG: endonuclease [Spongiibacter sp.]|uniref:endonuclease/exonuclease/phosphatase family protein n=1 Tax=Spongiibacter sp. TaxID=2024860 RepID=UPI000C0A7EC1|nr:endonuclease/exonuclease/phosphatase family protein [Spongiibacter sp.]MAK44085.1 endonuclease [Spongiibacter sp.]|tara:strand:+ start:116 stop:1168 length:1053 start_codon:yes stop_codon:yes gene_type:complete
MPSGYANDYRRRDLGKLPPLGTQQYRHPSLYSSTSLPRQYFCIEGHINGISTKIWTLTTEEKETTHRQLCENIKFKILGYLRTEEYSLKILSKSRNRGYAVKIITWNCNGGFRKKYHSLDCFDADLLVIQECEDPAQSTQDYRTWAGDYIWIGESKNKGIGVFPRKDHSVEQLKWHGSFKITGLCSTSLSLSWSTSDLRLFLPFRLSNGITALAVWTKGRESQAFGYIGQFWKYLQIHRTELAGDRTMILGDFNSNAQWDKPDRWWSHSDTVTELETIGLLSLYHQQTQDKPGAETKPTFYLQKKHEKPYHIDYVFLTSALSKGAKLEVGRYEQWIPLSDHMPITFELKV